jgi:hypothetical protein
VPTALDNGQRSPRKASPPAAFVLKWISEWRVPVPAQAAPSYAASGTGRGRKP